MSITIADRKRLRESVDSHSKEITESAPLFDQKTREDLRAYIEASKVIAEETTSGNFDMNALPKVDKKDGDEDKTDDEVPEDVHHLDVDDEVEDTEETDREGDMGITPGQFPHN